MKGKAPKIEGEYNLKFVIHIKNYGLDSTEMLTYTLQVEEEYNPTEEEKVLVNKILDIFENRLKAHHILKVLRLNNGDQDITVDHFVK